MQALLWMVRMKHWQWRGCQGGHSLQGIKKKNCVKAHNKTCTRPRLLHPLQTQGEEKAFLIGLLLAPSHYSSPTPQNWYIFNIQPINHFFSLIILFVYKKWIKNAYYKEKDIVFGGDKGDQNYMYFSL